LQCVAVCCSVLQCVAVCCSVLQCIAVCCSVLQCVAVCCSMLQRAPSHTHHLRARLANRRVCRRRKFLNLNRRACHASQFPHAKFNFTTSRTACASAWRVLRACCSRASSSQSGSIRFASRTQQAVNFSSTTVFVRIQLLHDLSTRPATCTRTCCSVCCSVCCSLQHVTCNPYTHLLQCVLLQCVLQGVVAVCVAVCYV